MLFSDVGIYWSGNVKMVKNRALMMPRCVCLSHTVSHTVRAVVVLHGSSSCTWCCSGLLSGRCCCRPSALVLRPREVGRAPQTGAWRCTEFCCVPDKPCKNDHASDHKNWFTLFNYWATLGQLLVTICDCVVRVFLLSGCFALSLLCFQEAKHGPAFCDPPGNIFYTTPKGGWHVRTCSEESCCSPQQQDVKNYSIILPLVPHKAVAEVSE